MKHSKPYRSLAAALCVACSLQVQAQSADFATWQRLGDASGSGAAGGVSTAFDDESPASGTGALDYISLEGALGVASGALGSDSFEGSALQTSFNVLAGSVLSFNWNLGTVGFDPGFADRAFVVVDGSTVLPLGTVAAAAVTGSFSWVFGAGAHSFAVGVVDVNDVAGVSTLQLSGLQVTAVPEPASAALLLAGAALLVARRAFSRG